MSPSPSQNERDLASIIIGFTNQVAELASKVGELTGQVRELVHQGNNASAKLDAIGERVTKLEKLNERREGAVVFANGLRVWAPGLLAIVGIAVLVLKSTGKI